MGATINSVSTRRRAGATVVHSFTPVRSSIQDKKYRFLILSLGRLAQQGCWSDLRADTGTLFSPDKIQAKHSQTLWFVLCQRDVGRALVDRWCE